MSVGGRRAAGEPVPGPTAATDDRGSGTVLAIALVAVVLVLAASVAVLAGAYRAAAAARTAADLAALAAADALALPVGVDQAGDVPSSACERADAVAARNGAVLTGCDVEPGSVVVVRVERPAGLAAAVAQARAGPASARG